MANESTAIVNLLDLVQNKPLPKDVGDDDLFGGRARFDATAMPMPAQVIAPIPALPAFARKPAPAHMPTVRVPRGRDYNGLAKKLALPTGLFVVAMVLLSIYLAKGSRAPAASVASAPAPSVVELASAEPAKAAPIVTPIEEAKPAPVVTPIEPSEPAFVPTVPEPTVPAAAPAEEAPATVAAMEPAPVKASKVSKRQKVRDRRAAKRAKLKKQREARVAVVEKADRPAKAEKLGGKGALSISSSAPREVWIDGRNTKQLTPQRMVLAPGAHNVTLVDRETKKAKTYQVQIEPNKTSKLSR